MTIEKIIKDYQKSVKAAGKQLDELQERADETAEAVGEREMLQARLTAAEERGTGLMSKHEALKRRFADALYEDDTEQMEIIREQRIRLEQEIEAAEQEELQLQAELNEHDVDAEIVSVSGRVQSLYGVLPEYEPLLREMREIMRAERVDLQERIKALSQSLPRVDREVSEEIRLRDPAYREKKRKEREQLEREHQKEAEALEKEMRSRGWAPLPPGDYSNTDQVHAARGELRSVYPGRQNEEIEQGKARPWDTIGVEDEEIILPR